MTTGITDRIKVIDIDTHISEPEDLWTSRLSAKWGDRVPHVAKAGASGAAGSGAQIATINIDRAEEDDIWVIDGKPGHAHRAAGLVWAR